MTLQERLRDWQSVRMKPVELAHYFALACEAADALDAKADKINRLSARCESQRLKIDAQEKRIRELEGALREWLDAEDRPSGVWATDLRRVNDIMKRARAALKDAGAS